MTIDGSVEVSMGVPDTWYVSPTTESKEKGDEGLYAAIEAARLARVLRGATIRSHVRSNPAINPNAVTLAAPPRKWETLPLGEGAENELLAEITGGDAAVAQYRYNVAVALPDDSMMEELCALVPRIHNVKPHPVMSYDEVERLMRLLALDGANVTCLDLGDGAVMPRAYKESSPETILKKMEELRQRFPLPTPKPKPTDTEDNDEEVEEEVEDEVDLTINEELKTWCESQQIEYTNYSDAIRSRAAFELDAFRNICAMLMTNTMIRVLILSHNEIGGAPPNANGDVEGDAEEPVSLVPLRLLAKVIDANEIIKVLDLSHNALGPHGFGIIGKALTKNIAITALDLSSNQLGLPPPETTEDPEYTTEDPVFGETYSGLEALSEVIKKNKFLRLLRLARNQIHAGGEGEEPPVCDPAEMDPEHDANAPDVEAWEELPLWRLVGPLREYHRLRALDLSGNALGPDGARMLATALAANRSVEVLDLTENAIGPRGLHYIAKLVLAEPKSALHTLILRRNELAGRQKSRAQQRMALAAAEATATALDGNTRLRRLSLAGNYLGTVLCTAMLRTLCTATALEELDLESNDCCGNVVTPHETRALEHIAAALYTTDVCNRKPTLAVLRLGGNNIRAAGVRQLFPAPDSIPLSLREVDLSRNSIGNELDAVGHLLSASPLLTQLSLAHNNIASAAALIPGMMLNKELTTLDLSHNKIGSLEPRYCVDPQAQVEGVAKLLQTIAQHPSLNNINLSHNDFAAEHGHIIAETLCGEGSAHKQVRRLDISANPELRQADVEQMVQAIGKKPGIEAFYVSSSYPCVSDKNHAQAEAYDQCSLLQMVRETVFLSPTLLDINCDLQCCTVSDEDIKTEVDESIGTMRQRLLLNALMNSTV